MREWLASHMYAVHGTHGARTHPPTPAAPPERKGQKMGPRDVDDQVCVSGCGYVSSICTTAGGFDSLRAGFYPFILRGRPNLPIVQMISHLQSLQIALLCGHQCMQI